MDVQVLEKTEPKLYLCVCVSKCGPINASRYCKHAEDQFPNELAWYQDKMTFWSIYYFFKLCDISLKKS